MGVYGSCAHLFSQRGLLEINLSIHNVKKELTTDKEVRS